MASHFSNNRPFIRNQSFQQPQFNHNVSRPMGNRPRFPAQGINDVQIIRNQRPPHVPPGFSADNNKIHNFSPRFQQENFRFQHPPPFQGPGNDSRFQSPPPQIPSISHHPPLQQNVQMHFPQHGDFQAPQNQNLDNSSHKGQFRNEHTPDLPRQVQKDEDARWIECLVNRKNVGKTASPHKSVKVSLII